MSSDSISRLDASEDSQVGATKSCTSDELADDLLIELLKAVEKLHILRTEMHICLKQGFLNMTKARRSLGRNSVTVLNTREEYTAQSTITIQGKPLDTHIAAIGAGVFTRDRDIGALPPIIGDGSLRQRPAVGGSQWTVEEASPQVEPDTLNLFTGLVPPPLRKSKGNFSSALDYVVETANLAYQVAALHRKIEEIETSRT